MEPNPHGKFIWYDFVTTDAKAALDFYCPLIGWTHEAMPMADGGTYYVLSANGRGMGGVFQMTEAQHAGMPTGWVGYFGSDDVDRDAARVEKLGGRAHRKPEDIPDVGRLSPASDPLGAGFVLFKPKPPSGKTRVFPEGVGTVAWNELHTTDSKRAFSFYSELFGWRKGEAMKMPVGVYQLFRTNADGPDVGGMMDHTQPNFQPYWLYYFQVGALDAAVRHAIAHGANILHGAETVPGGGWMAQVRDPFGGQFALFADKR